MQRIGRTRSSSAKSRSAGRDQAGISHGRLSMQERTMISILVRRKTHIPSLLYRYPIYCKAKPIASFVEEMIASTRKIGITLDSTILLYGLKSTP